MKILLTGHKGFIGSHMLKALEKEHNVATFDWEDKEGPFITPDIDWIVHLGAISSTTETDIDKLMTQNFEFSVMLYERSSQYDIKFQYASSASLYGLGTEFSETSPLDPRTPYAFTKHLFETYVNSNPKNRICQGFRYFNVYGEGEEHKGSQASPYTQFRKQAQETGKIKVFEGSENYRRDFVPVEKVVETHMKFFDVEESGIWNIGSGTATSFMEIAESFNVPIETIAMPEEIKHSYQTYTCADLTKLNKTLEVL